MAIAYYLKPLKFTNLQRMKNQEKQEIPTLAKMDKPSGRDSNFKPFNKV